MTTPGIDPLSTLANDLIKSATYDGLTVRGPASRTAIDQLAPVTPEQLLAVPVTSPAHAAAMLSGLWLWHDVLEESHRIAQKSPQELNRAAVTAQVAGGRLALFSPPHRLDDPAYNRLTTSTLAFWHAIMHRREGDFSNSMYWYDRCEGHPAMAAIGQEAALTINPLPADKSFLRLLRGGWDPDMFVDLVAEVNRQPSDPRLPVVRILQRIEWRQLFDYCTREAVA